MDGISDQDILKVFSQKGKEEKAFALILDKYQERIYWHVRKIVLQHEDANDVLQNTFIKIWKGLPSFRGDSELYTWIYRIATNEALSFLKQKANKNGKNVEDPDLALTNMLKADEYFDGDDLQLKLQLAMSHLPEKQRLVFQMKYYEDMKYERISEILNTSVGALKASYHHAVRKIREEIGED